MIVVPCDKYKNLWSSFDNTFYSLYNETLNRAIDISEYEVRLTAEAFNIYIAAIELLKGATLNMYENGIYTEDNAGNIDDIKEQLGKLTKDMNEIVSQLKSKRI